MKSLQNLTLAQVYPQVSGDTKLNCCGDPDCGNYAIEPAPTKHSFVGRGAAERRLKAAMADPAIARGVGRYKMMSESDAANHRETDAFEFAGDPRAWSDGRVIVCQHLRGNSECGVQSKLLSNEAFEQERHRLWTQNGLLEGPHCGNCGTSYLEASEEFIFNGANGKPSRKVGHKTGSQPRVHSVRVIHKRCQGLPGARFTVSTEHRRQKKRDENIQILSLIANGAGIHDLRRVLRSPRGETEPGMSRLYDRIFWLERTLLAYEKAQLAECRKRIEKQRIKDGKPYTHTRIAHDDIVIGVNWQTKIDRKITQLNCSVSADIKSGYVFRCDVDFDPTVDPLEVVEEVYFGVARHTALRMHYRNSKGTFTAPLIHFQRPTARFDEPALFAAAEKRLRLFAGRTARAFDAAAAPLTNEAYAAIQRTSARADEIEHLRDHWFNLVQHERDSLDGIVTRDTYTKAVSLACLKMMVPPGKITLVGEQEGAMGRVVPHIFRQEILEDRFEWAVVGFEKEATIGMIESRRAEFRESLDTWRDAHPHLKPWEALQSWTGANLCPAYNTGPRRRGQPLDGSELRLVGVSSAMAPQPDPGGERDRQDRRIPDPVAALPAGLPQAQPRRTDHRPGAPSGDCSPGYRSDASANLDLYECHSRARQRCPARRRPKCSPGAKLYQWRRIQPARADRADEHLACPLQFFRLADLHRPSRPGDEAEEIEPRMRRLVVPGTDKTILVPLRRAARARRTTPAMRMGVQIPSAPKASSISSIEPEADVGEGHPEIEPEAVKMAADGECEVKRRDRRRDDRPFLPDISRILY